MPAVNNHQMQSIFSQLQWIEKRKHRILDGIGAHFGNNWKKDLAALDFASGASLREALDEREPEAFVADLAYKVEKEEARTVQFLREKVSRYPEHVDEQILFASRSAGQDAGRHHLAQHEYNTPRDLPVLLASLERLCFWGLPADRCYFSSLRPLADFSLHFRSCPHTKAWREGGGDPAFLGKVEQAWIQGLLDILSPDVTHIRRYSIPQGDEYGLDLFIPRRPHDA